MTRPFRLVVPSIGLDVAVAQGVSNAALRVAPGYDPLSAFPGERGNCVIASHRNIHGAYFWYLTKIVPGAIITLQTPRESFNYKVASAQLVPEARTEVLENQLLPGAAPRLTLYTCTLPVSSKRFVVVANLVARGVKPPGPIGRSSIIPEITSGPLHLLKDRALQARYRALLRYAQENPIEASDAMPAATVKPSGAAKATLIP